VDWVYGPFEMIMSRQQTQIRVYIMNTSISKGGR
jgi:hypothetical protein